jgi:hypothetical protein
MQGTGVETAGAHDVQVVSFLVWRAPELCSRHRNSAAAAAASSQPAGAAVLPAPKLINSASYTYGWRGAECVCVAITQNVTGLLLLIPDPRTSHAAPLAALDRHSLPSSVNCADSSQAKSKDSLTFGVFSLGRIVPPSCFWRVQARDGLGLIGCVKL